MDSLFIQACTLRDACKDRGWNTAAYIANMLVSELASRLDLDPIERRKLDDGEIRTGLRSGGSHD